MVFTKYGLISEQARVGHIEVPFYNSFFTDTLYHGEQCAWLLLQQQVDIQCIETKLNTTFIDIAVFVFSVPMLTLSVKFVPMIKFH